MCACEPTYTCSRCRGTQHDPWLADEPSPRELEEQRRESLLVSVLPPTWKSA